MIEGLKPFYNGVLRPALWLFVRMGVHPNHLTVAGVGFFAAAGVVSALGHWYVAAVLVTLGAVLDGWDGLLARETNAISRFGAILDSVCDRLTEIAWLGGILCYYALAAPADVMGICACAAAISGSLMVSYVKARCEGAGIECREGLLQRPERIILIGVFTLLGPAILPWGLAAVATLAYYTVVQRLVIAWRACRRMERQLT